MNPLSIRFQPGDRVKLTRPAFYERGMQDAVGTVLVSSKVPCVQFDKFGKLVMLQSQLDLFKVIKLENK